MRTKSTAGIGQDMCARTRRIADPWSSAISFAEIDPSPGTGVVETGATTPGALLWTGLHGAPGQAASSSSIVAPRGTRAIVPESALVNSYTVGSVVTVVVVTVVTVV